MDDGPLKSASTQEEDRVSFCIDLVSGLFGCGHVERATCRGYAGRSGGTP